jgi:hypothetical protein
MQKGRDTTSGSKHWILKAHAPWSTVRWLNVHIVVITPQEWIELSP